MIRNQHTFSFNYYFKLNKNRGNPEYSHVPITKLLCTIEKRTLSCWCNVHTIEIFISVESTGPSRCGILKWCARLLSRHFLGGVLTQWESSQIHKEDRNRLRGEKLNCGDMKSCHPQLSVPPYWEWRGDAPFWPQAKGQAASRIHSLSLGCSVDKVSDLSLAYFREGDSSYWPEALKARERSEIDLEYQWKLHCTEE